MIRDSSLIYSKESFRSECELFAFVCLSLLTLRLPRAVGDKHGSSSRFLLPTQSCRAGLNNTIAQSTIHEKVGRYLEESTYGNIDREYSQGLMFNLDFCHSC